MRAMEAQKCFAKSVCAYCASSESSMLGALWWKPVVVN